MSVKIGANTINNIQSVFNDRTRKNAPVKENLQSFDRVLIKTDSREKAEAKIASDIRREALRKVFAPRDNAERISTLRQQVADGTYDVDPERLAGRILDMEA